MKYQIGATVAVLISIVIGITCQQDPYKIREIGREGDQLALDHRDSPYSHISWITSDSGNYAQLRFFDKVEGGACLNPSWDNYAQLAKTNPQLTHLVPNKPWAARGKPGKKWPKDKPHPSPGTLPNTKYVCLFPASVLLNRDVMAEAENDPRKAKPNIIIVGLGSAIGISVFAHHFPEASITVVDIDQAVIDMVYDHYPFIEWLSKQTCSDGRPRLKISAGDARQFMHYPQMRNDNGLKYDVAVLDAYTSGSTIPSHLMTKEFFQQIKDLLRPNGILMSNIIGSYTGAKKFVVGGAMRSMQAAGLEHIHNFPILAGPLQSDELMGINNEQARNNIIMACASPIDPGKHRVAWENLRQFMPYSDLPLDSAVTEQITLLAKDKAGNLETLSTSVGMPPIDASVLRKIRADAEVFVKKYLAGKKTLARYDDFTRLLIEDASLVQSCIQGVEQQWGKTLPLGWSHIPAQSVIFYQRTDWVLFTRRTYQRSMMASRARGEFGYTHDGGNIVGRADGSGRASSLIPDAPVFTDAQPNADIYNR